MSVLERSDCTRRLFWSLFALSQSLQLSIIRTQVTISHSCFLSHHTECLFRCFSLHVDANSPDAVEKSVNGFAPSETFRWSVVRAPGIWVIMGSNVFLGSH